VQDATAFDVCRFVRPGIFALARQPRAERREHRRHLLGLRLRRRRVDLLSHNKWICLAQNSADHACHNLGFAVALYLFWRNHGKGEDYRYQAMRKRSKNFALLSLPMVFIFQGVLIWLISWPIQFAQMRADELTAFDFIGAALWAIGLTVEAVGDWQLARFKADANNKGQVMARGLWRYTRHPNYFGDALLWWGIFCFALPSGWWTIVSPIVMTTLLLKISGLRCWKKRSPKPSLNTKRTCAARMRFCLGFRSTAKVSFLRCSAIW
jgi:protein-S-isoprenylcysteine O-methyltransferase Ste14